MLIAKSFAEIRVLLLKSRHFSKSGPATNLSGTKFVVGGLRLNWSMLSVKLQAFANAEW